jgi:hypothetical protein
MRSRCCMATFRAGDLLCTLATACRAVPAHYFPYRSSPGFEPRVWLRVEALSRYKVRSASHDLRNSVTLPEGNSVFIILMPILLTRYKCSRSVTLPDLISFTFALFTLLVLAADYFRPSSEYHLNKNFPTNPCKVSSHKTPSYQWFSKGLWQWLIHYGNTMLDIVKQYIRQWAISNTVFL